MAIAASNLRLAGLDEKETYHALRKLVKDPPTYRELRREYKRYGVSYGSIRGERNLFIKTDKSGKVRHFKSTSNYRERKKAQFTERQVSRLNVNYAKGYLLKSIPSGKLSEVISDERLIEYVESEYEGPS